MRKSWILSCAIGEAAGIAVVASTYAALDRGMLSVAVAWVLAAGAWEGLCLGTAQAMQLRTLEISPSRWIGLTITGALAGYGLSLLGGAGQGGNGGAEPGLVLVMLAGAGLGLAMGALMGALQWLAAREVMAAKRWILANMAGWAVAMAIILAAASSVSADWPLGWIALAGLISGGLAGAGLGLITAMALPAGAGRA